MKNFRTFTGIAVATALLVALPAAAEPAYEWITDPAELAARGFDPDGPPIKRLTPVDDDRPFELRLTERLQLAEAAKAGVDVGGPAVRWAAVQGTDFKFLDETAAYSTTGNFVLHPVAGSPNRFADAPVLLRDDRRLLWLDVWTNDTNPTGFVDVALYRVCYPSFSAGVPDVTELAVVEGGTFSGGNRFDFSSVPGPTHVDNGLCTYYVRARFSSVSVGATVQVQKVRVYWAG